MLMPHICPQGSLSFKCGHYQAGPTPEGEKKKKKVPPWVAELTSQLVHRTPKVLSMVKGKGSSGIVRRAGFMGLQKTLAHESQSFG